MSAVTEPGVQDALSFHQSIGTNTKTNTATSRTSSLKRCKPLSAIQRSAPVTLTLRIGTVEPGSCISSRYRTIPANTNKINYITK